MNTDKPKSLLDVAQDVRKEHQDQLQKERSEPKTEDVAKKASADVQCDKPDSPEAVEE